jgi:tetratricopeptide (TPR) repeat protein
MSRHLAAAAALLTVCMMATAATAQVHDPRALAADPTLADSRIAPVLEGLGDEHLEITTSDPQAQRFFDQGLRLTYGFNHSEALRAFKEAARLDPDCAMAYWGWALVLGPNINLPMQPEVRAQAWRAIEEAVARRDEVTEKERAFIDALAVRYSGDEEETPESRRALDEAYAEAMKRLHETYPDDSEAATLYAASLMNLMPWNYWHGDGTPNERTLAVMETLEGVIHRDPEHTGAIHYYIHTVEEKRPQLAEAGADKLATLAPRAGHLVHMPAHIYMRLGRYEDSYNQNAKAVAADEGYIANCNAQGVYPLGYYPHNIHFMVWSAMFEGRSAETLEMARKVASRIPDHIDEQNWGAYELFRSQPMYAMVRFGLWEQVLAEPKPIEKARYMTGIWHYSRALANLHTGSAGKARRELRRLRSMRLEMQGLEDDGYYANLLTIATLIVEAELEAARGRYHEALPRLERAVRLEGVLGYSEPPSWYFPVRHLLGAVLIEAGQPAEAEVVYWADLAANPENGFALFGLERSLRAQQKSDEADAIGLRFEKAWARADVELATSRF